MFPAYYLERKEKIFLHRAIKTSIKAKVVLLQQYFFHPGEQSHTCTSLNVKMPYFQQLNL